MAKTHRPPRPTRRGERKSRLQQLQQQKDDLLQETQVLQGQLGEKLKEMGPRYDCVVVGNEEDLKKLDVMIAAEKQRSLQLKAELQQVQQEYSDLQQLQQGGVKLQPEPACCCCCNTTAVGVQTCKDRFNAMSNEELYPFLGDNGYFGLRSENGKEIYREFTKILDFISYDSINPIDNPGAFKNGKFLVEWPDRKEPTWEESAGFWYRGMVGCWEFLEFLIRKQIDERSKEIEEENWRKFEKRIKEEKILRNIPL